MPTCLLITSLRPTRNWLLRYCVDKNAKGGFSVLDFRNGIQNKYSNIKCRIDTELINPLRF